MASTARLTARLAVRRRFVKFRQPPRASFPSAISESYSRKMVQWPTTRMRRTEAATSRRERAVETNLQSREEVNAQLPPKQSGRRKARRSKQKWSLPIAFQTWMTSSWHNYESHSIRAMLRPCSTSYSTVTKGASWSMTSSVLNKLAMLPLVLTKLSPQPNRESSPFSNKRVLLADLSPWKEI